VAYNRVPSGLQTTNSGPFETGTVPTISRVVESISVTRLAVELVTATSGDGAAQSASANGESGIGRTCTSRSSAISITETVSSL